MRKKYKKYHTVGTVPKSNKKIVETETKPISLDTHVRRRSLSWLGTGTSVTSGGIKLIVWPQLSNLVK